jgi:sialic acid synthase SpsE
MHQHKQYPQFPLQRSLPCVQVGSRILGADFPPVFWPDIDVYFRGNLSQALYLVDKIYEAGGAFLKGAVLHRKDLCLHSDKEVSYFDKALGKVVLERYDQVIQRHVVSLESLATVFTHARTAGMNLVLSVYDSEGVSFALDQGACAIKIPSSNITHKQLIECVAGSGLPMVVDTGRSKFYEIKRAVGWVVNAGAGERLIIQHSPPGPPADASRFHMTMLRQMGRCFKCPVGLSDHHRGLDMFPIAVALGASVIEKGLVADDAEIDIDTAHALPVSKMKQALGLIHESWEALGKGVRPDEEVPPHPVDRMCIIAAEDIEKGQRIDREMLAFAFPTLGIGAEDVDAVIGATALEFIRAGEPLTPDSIAPNLFC